MEWNGNNGWDGGPNTIASSAMDCLKICSSRGKDRIYFGFASKEPGEENSCACFFGDRVCEPGTNPRMDIYRVDWTNPYFTEGIQKSGILYLHAE